MKHLVVLYTSQDEPSSSSTSELVKSNSSSVLPVRGDTIRIGSTEGWTDEGVDVADAVDISAAAGRFRFGGVCGNNKRL
jgi:hypothetical protein